MRRLRRFVAAHEDVWLILGLVCDLVSVLGALTSAAWTVFGW